MLTPALLSPGKSQKKMNSGAGHTCDAGTGKPDCAVSVQVNVVQPGQWVSRYRGKAPPASTQRKPRGSVAINTPPSKAYFSQGIFRSSGEGAGNTAKRR